MIQSKKKVCSLCKKSYIGWGNTAYPLSDRKCCDDCNKEHVIPARIKQLIKKKW